MFYICDTFASMLLKLIFKPCLARGIFPSDLEKAMFILKQKKKEKKKEK